MTVGQIRYGFPYERKCKKPQFKLRGETDDQKESPDVCIKAAFDRKELPTPEPGSMCYMISKEAYLTDRGSHDLAHLMFEVPRIDDAAWGANLPNSPVMGGTEAPEPFSEFIVPVGKWSDGTAVPTN